MDKSIADTPLVSVVMGVYNGEQYLDEAVQSILDQTFSDFEFIIIDDGSTDGTASMLKKYNDSRIRIITHTENKGLVPSLNNGISQARGLYVARQDADDRSELTRLKKQVDFLKDNKLVGLVGSSMNVMDEKSQFLHTHHVLLGDTELRQELLVRSPFAHGSVMFKKQLASEAGLYNSEFWPAEDYEFWLRLSSHGKLANINEPLYTYRENTRGISSQNESKQINQTHTIQKIAWSKYRNILVSGAGSIKPSDYLSLKDGLLRIQRIRNNLLRGVRLSLTHLQLVMLYRHFILILATKVRSSPRKSNTELGL